MTEQRLHRRQIHASLKQMGDAAVTQRKVAAATANRAVVDCGLHAAPVHGGGRRLHALRPAARVRKQQLRMTMGAPEPTQNFPGPSPEASLNDPLSPLAAAHVHAPARGIDLQLQPFARAQIQTVDREETDPLTQLARDVDQLEGRLSKCPEF